MPEVSDSDLAPDPSATPVAEMIAAESGGNPRAVSPKGARGIMQIMPATAKGMGVDPNTLFDPSVNVGLGSKLYQQNLKMFGGDKRKALAAYNWGPGNVKLHPNEPDWPKETQAYVNKIAGPRQEQGDVGPHEITDADLAPEPEPEKLTAKQEQQITPEQAEARRHAVEGGGTDMSDPLIENLAIGVGTAGLIPGISGVASGIGFLPKTLGGKLLNAGIGTAEQYLYGWLSEKGQQLGNQVGPKTGLAASIALPIAAGVLEGKLGSGIGRFNAPVSSAQESAAKAAAEKAEGELYEKTPKQIFEYGEDIDAANKRALAKTKGAFEKAGALRQQAGEAATASDRAAQEQLKDKAAQQIMQDYFGRSPEETAAARRLPLEDLALHRANMRNSVFGPINRISDELGAEFEKAAAGRGGELVEDTSQLANDVADSRKWVDDRGATLSKPVNDLIRQLPSGGGMVDDELESRITDLLGNQKLATPQEKIKLGEAFDDWRRNHSGQGLDISGEGRKIAAKVLGGPTGAAPTVNELLGWRTEASKLVASQKDHNQVVAMDLRDAIDKSLEGAGIKIPQTLREKWGLYKSLFDSKFRRNVAVSANPLGYGKKLFESPERALAIIRNATPDERQSLKQLLVDHVYSSGYSPKTFTKRIDPGVLHELFGGTPYEKMAPWLTTEIKSDAWEKAVANNPVIEQQIEIGKQSALAEISVQRAKDVRDAYIKLAQKMGPAGKGMLAKVLAHRDPIAAAQMIEREFPFTPEAAQNLYREAQMNPAKVAFQKGIGQRALSAEGIEATREQAAVNALMQNPNSAMMNGLKRRLFAWHLPMLLAGAGTGLATGHAMGGGYQAGISGMILGMMAAEKFRGMLRPALTDPEAAREYWRAIDSVPSALNARKFGARMMRMAIAVGASNLGKQKQDLDQDNQ